MKTLLFVRALILLGIGAPFIPSTNGGLECYSCRVGFTSQPVVDPAVDPCWNNTLSVEKEKCGDHTGGYDCITDVYWRDKFQGTPATIERGCYIKGFRAPGPGECNPDAFSPLLTRCSCDTASFCNNKPFREIIHGDGSDGKGGDKELGGGGSGGALAVLVGPSFGTLVMGLVLGVGGALLPLLFQ